MAHIVSAFDEDLVQVQAKISEMGGLCEELLSKALRVGAEPRRRARPRGDRARPALDAMEMALEETVVKVIALRQPVAADLRVLIAAMKIASTLERIGDLAKNIAKRAIPLSSARPIKLTTSIVRMGRADADPALGRAERARLARRRPRGADLEPGLRDRRDVQRHLPRGRHLHGRGQPADRGRRAADVHRQEPRADRRPHHAHLRDGLLHRHRQAASATTGPRASRRASTSSSE